MYQFFFKSLFFSVVSVSIFVGCGVVEGNEKSVVGLRFEGYPTFLDAPAATGAVIMDPMQRELARQTVSLVLREEFGFATRDEALLESLTKCDRVLDLKVVSKRNKEVLLEVREGKEKLYGRACRLYAGWITGYNSYTDKYSILIRSELVKALEKAGFQRKPNKKLKPEDTLPISAKVEDLLLQMNHISQLHALRILHREIKEEGESTTRLGGLSRAYANLGQLTSRTLDSRSFVFRARALLYANRAAILGRNSPEVWRDLIYANAMVGLPAKALAYKNRIDRTALRKGVEIEEDQLAKLVLNYCNHQFGKLRKVAVSESELSQLAAVFMQKSAEHTYRGSIPVKTGLVASKHAQDCPWILCSAANKAGVSTLHQVTYELPRIHARQLDNHLLEWSKLPDEVRELVESRSHQSLSGRAKIVQAFNAASEQDVAEPSWAVVGRGIEAIDVLNIAILGRFLKFSLGVDSSGEIERAEPAFRNHPDAALIRTLGLPERSPIAAYQELLNEYSFKDGNWHTSLRLLKQVPASVKLKNMTAGQAHRQAVNISSNTEGIFIYSIINRAIDRRLEFADWISKVSPNSPLRYSTYMRYDFKNHLEEVDIWVNENSDHPAVLQAAGQAYLKNGDVERAIELFDRYLEMIPDRWPLTQLAQHYYKAEEDEKWLSTMERMLELEDLGLNHAVTGQTVASTYMHRGEFEKALPWARRANQSGSAWGMQCLVDCLVGLKKFDEAEKITVEIMNRYNLSSSRNQWVEWCFEMEQGDIEAASKLHNKQLVKFGRDARLKHKLVILANKDPAEVCKLLEKNLGIREDPIELINLAVTYDGLKKTKERDQALKRLAAGKFPVYSEFARELTLFIDGEEISEERLREIAAGKPDEYYSFTRSLNYYVGVLRINRDQKERGIENLKLAARNSNWAYGRALAWRKLRELGIDPIQIEKRDFSRQFTR